MIIILNLLYTYLHNLEDSQKPINLYVCRFYMKCQKRKKNLPPYLHNLFSSATGS